MKIVVISKFYIWRGVFLLKPYHVLSKKFYYQVAALMLATTAGIGTVAVAPVSTAFASTAQQTTTEDATLAKLAQQLYDVHQALQADSAGLAAVRAAEAAAKAAATATPPTVWDGILYPGVTILTGSSQQQFVTAVTTLVSTFTYANMLPTSTSTSTGSLTTQSTDVQALYTALHGLDPSVTGPDIYNFFESFKSSVIRQVITASAGTSLTSIVDNALQTAANNTTNIADLLTMYGQTPASLATMRAAISSNFDSSGTALNAIVTAYASTNLIAQTQTSLTAGQAPVTYDLYTTASSSSFGSIKLDSLVTWTSTTPSVLSFNGNIATVGSVGSTTVTASVHGYAVQKFTVYVSAASSGGGSTGGSGSGGSGSTGGSTGGTGSTGGNTGGSGSNLPPGTQNAFKQTLVTQQVPTTGGTITTKTGDTSIDVNVPAGAFPTPETISLTSGNPSSADLLVSGNGVVAITLGVNFSGPAPTKPITVTLSNPSIPAGAKIYKIAADGTLVPVTATVTNGKAVITFSSDPNFVVVVPASIVHKGIYLNGHETSNAPAFVKSGTTYMPIWYVMHALQQAGIQSKWDGTHWNLVPPANVATDLTNLNPGVGTMQLQINGKQVQDLTGIVAQDPSTGRATTYMPVYDVMLALKRTGVTNTWNGTNWSLSSPHTATSNLPVLKLGATGSAVVTLQHDLGITADGSFGPATLAAVKKFQASHGLVADGVVGAATWAALQH